MISEQQAEDSLRKAREIVADFITKRADHEKKLQKLGQERAALSYDAHRGDPKSRKRLDDLHLTAAKMDSEFLSLDAAVSEAQSRVKDAEAAVTKAQAAAKAQQILGLLPDLREHGKLLDRALLELIDNYEKFQNTARTIRALTNPGTDAAGMPLSTEKAVPSEALMRVGCKRALIAGLCHTDLEVERLAPSDRHTFAEIVDGWSESIRHWARRRLPENILNRGVPRNAPCNSQTQNHGVQHC
jgi:hypothetical protein